MKLEALFQDALDDVIQRIGRGCPPFSQPWHLERMSGHLGQKQLDLLHIARARSSLPEPQRDGKAERFFAAIGAVVRWNAARAAYEPSDDAIYMPPRHAFLDAPGLYRTLAREHVRWARGKRRLKGTVPSAWAGNPAAYDEIVAELGSVFVLATLKLQYEPSASYVDCVLKAAGSDADALRKAAPVAQRAATHLRVLAQIAPI